MGVALFAVAIGSGVEFAESVRDLERVPRALFEHGCCLGTLECECGAFGILGLVRTDIPTGLVGRIDLSAKNVLLRVQVGEVSLEPGSQLVPLRGIECTGGGQGLGAHLDGHVAK